MRPDQITRMRELCEKLADMVFEETDFALWPGAEVPVDQWDKNVRGDRYWLKKNVAASMSLLDRSKSIVDKFVTPDPDHPPPSEFDVDKEIATAERQAAKLVEKALSNAGKQAFDDHVHGKKH